MAFTASLFFVHLCAELSVFCILSEITTVTLGGISLNCDNT